MLILNESLLCVRMKRVSKHRFWDDSEREVTNIQISEVMEENYGLYVWPGSIVLAEYIWQHRTLFRGAQVLELGAGTALPGILAAKLGAHVTLTDLENNSECFTISHDTIVQPYNIHLQVFENMARNCEENQVGCKILSLTWGSWDQNMLNLNPDVVLGADVLYNSSDFDDLFATVAFLLQKNPAAVFITAYEPRSAHRSIEFLMAKWKLQCIKLVDAHEILPQAKLLSVSTSVEIAEIKSL
ncbi:hypothetical protein KP509_29G051100 [Ceratopteris richardii]|uniref:Methyltransferase-like protein 23 n=1 Tax=Ceratopteris richardii TaxID=49495 RepID=A0A8T2R6W6_CERRI|nr:hypothetical protein KP509_29G051100 [Ceratopteris richardii]